LLRKKDVAVMPGGSFGEQAINFIRVSLTVDDERLAVATQRMAELAAEIAEPGEGLRRVAI
ncbi:MAG: pyridoxal phosphate-dependent aminotransferase, partial [Rhizobium sp.]|nr:pyridoxal phosphate-dependent aminotransferase [Rhizobium sp.]